MSLTIVIPSYLRGAVVLNSVRALLTLQDAADEIIVVDQTLQHPAEVERELTDLHQSGRVRWLRLPEPSIPCAMNQGLLQATSEIVLFVDDDIVPHEGLVRAHRAAAARAKLVAGMVLQPGESPVDAEPGNPPRFNSTRSGWVHEFIGCNFSVRRSDALALGGFDENFVGAAFRYEGEFAFRFEKRFGRIWFSADASLKHLRIASGGTRAQGSHLETTKPHHAVGAYYELLRTRRPGWLWQLLWRPLRSIRTRHHLRRPWWIPLTLLAELRGLLLALRLNARGPALIKPDAARVAGAVEQA